MKLVRSLLIAALLTTAATSTLSLAASRGQESQHSAAYASASRKIAWLRENGQAAQPSHRPTVLTASEWNAYLNEGGVTLPEGVSRVRISSQPAVLHGDADVDFDQLTANRTRNNPFLSLFTGKHHVTVVAQAAAANGVGTVRVESVALDGVEVPRIALEYFSNRFLRPKYGRSVGMDSTFRLRSRVDTAILGLNQVTITQR